MLKKLIVRKNIEDVRNEKKKVKLNNMQTKRFLLLNSRINSFNALN